MSEDENLIREFPLPVFKFHANSINHLGNSSQHAIITLRSRPLSSFSLLFNLSILSHFSIQKYELSIQIRWKQIYNNNKLCKLVNLENERDDIFSLRWEGIILFQNKFAIPSIRFSSSHSFSGDDDNRKRNC